jgi:hypothetical protein
MREGCAIEIFRKASLTVSLMGFFDELGRRNVFRAVIGYAVVAWLS